MADSIANLLLRITGDGDDAEQTMAQMAAALQALDSQDATMETKLKGDAGVQASIASLMASINALDKESAEIDVKVDKDGAAKKGISSLIGALGGMSESLSGGGNAFSNIGVRIAGFSLQLNPLVGLIMVIAYTAIGALVAALVALVASLGAAIAAIGALAVALGSLLLPAALLVGGVIAKFKADSEKAGTVAHALAGAFKELKSAFGEAMGPAANAFMARIIGGINALLPLVKSLGPPMTAFARAAGDAFSRMLSQLGSMGPEFGHLIRVAAPAFAGIIDLIAPLAAILINIARATMPFLTSGINAVGDAFQRWAKSTSNIGALRETIGGLVGHLKAWLGLVGALWDLMLGFFSAAAGSGKGLVGSLTDGAKALAAWVKSAEGSARIKEFFADIMPAAKAILGFIMRLVVVFALIVQAASPALKLIFDGFNMILDVVIFVIDKFMVFFQVLLVLASLFVGGFTAGLKVVTLGIKALAAGGRLAGVLLGTAFNLIRTLGLSLFNVMKSGAAGARTVVLMAFGAITSALTVMAGVMAHGVSFITGIWGGLKDAAIAVWGAIKSAITGAVSGTVSGVTAAWNWAKGAVSDVWNAIKGAAVAVWNHIRDSIRESIDRTTSAVRNGFGALRDWMGNLWSSIKGTVSSAWNSVKNTIDGAVDSATSAVRNAFGGLRDWMSGVWGTIRGVATTAWNAVKGNIIDPIRDAVGSVRNHVGNIYEAVRDKFNEVKSKAAEVWGDVKEKISSAISSAVGAVRGAVGQMVSAGAALIDGLIRGIGSKIEGAVAKVRDGVKRIKDILPGSEPKDPRSPLRGLDKAGAAIFDNMIKGVVKRTPALAQTLRAELTALPVSGLSPVSMGPLPVGPNQNAGDLHRHYHIPPGPGGGVEPLYAAAQLDRLLSNEGMAR